MGTKRGVCRSLVVVVPLGWGACAESSSRLVMSALQASGHSDRGGEGLEGSVV